MGESRRVHGWLSQLREERRAIVALADRAGLGPDRRCDIHLCYGDELDLAFKGFLVTWRGNLDRLIAYSPVMSQSMRDEARRGDDLLRAFTAAAEAASRPEDARRSPDLLWLGAAGDVDRPVPGWVYGLWCIPLTGEWDGEFHSPRPFCPTLFERMAEQPQAVRWLRNWQACPAVPPGRILTGETKPGGGEYVVAPTAAAFVPPPGDERLRSMQ